MPPPVVDGRVFDWFPPAAPDVRSLANYAMRAELSARPLRSKNRPLVPRLDQGAEGACVGFGFAHALACPPDVEDVTNVDGRQIYELAKTLDDEPGENYEGTSVLAGARACRELGRITRYLWCDGIDDVLETLAWEAGVTVGVWWREGMMHPDATGRVAATGSRVGGHCVTLHGLHLRDELVRGRNSWGEDWGHRGDFEITFADLEELLDDDGEACVVTKP